MAETRASVTPVVIAERIACEEFTRSSTQALYNMAARVEREVPEIQLASDFYVFDPTRFETIGEGKDDMPWANQIMTFIGGVAAGENVLMQTGSFGVHHPRGPRPALWVAGVTPRRGDHFYSYPYRTIPYSYSAPTVTEVDTMLARIIQKTNMLFQTVQSPFRMPE